MPETLMNRQETGNFRLKIDSIIAEAYREESMLEWASYRPEIDAPYNSMTSQDEFNIIPSEDSDELDDMPKDAIVTKKGDVDYDFDK